MNLKLTKQNRKWLHLGFAVEFFIIGLLLTTASKATTYEETVNRFCAKVVGIPYASDNFSQEEWERFKYCRDTLNRNK